MLIKVLKPPGKLSHIVLVSKRIVIWRSVGRIPHLESRKTSCFRTLPRRDPDRGSVGMRVTRSAPNSVDV